MVDKLDELLKDIYTRGFTMANSMHSKANGAIPNFDWISQTKATIRTYYKEKLLSVEEIEKLIPEVYCDVCPDTKKVIAYRKGEPHEYIYNLQMKRGKDLAQAIRQGLERRI